MGDQPPVNYGGLANARDDTLQANGVMLDTILEILSSILNQMARLDINERMLVTFDNTPSIIISSGTVTTVSSVATVTTVNAVTNFGASSKPGDLLIPNISQIASAMLYNQITIT